MPSHLKADRNLGCQKENFAETYLLEFSFSNEAFATVAGSRNPANIMVGIEVYSFFPQVFVLSFKKLQTIIIDEDVCGTSLELVCTDRLLDRLDRWYNNSLKALFIDGTLYGDVWKNTGPDALRGFGRVVFRVLRQLGHWSETLGETTHNDLCEKLIFTS